MTRARIAIALLLMPAMALAESRTYHDASGRQTGRSVTTGGKTTYYDHLGRNTGRAVTSADRTIVYDRMGRQVGTIRGR